MHLTGRKRFFADLVASTQLAFSVRGLSIKNLIPGDDEGTIEFDVAQGDQCITCVNLIISDTSDYPDNHVFFAFSPDNNIQPAAADILEALSNKHKRGRSIQDTIRGLLFDLAGTSDSIVQVSQTEEDDDEIEDDDDMADYALDFLDSQSALIDNERLQYDFIQTVAYDYRPGIIRFGGDDFVLSVSLPIVSLAKSIPPRVLMTWDRRLLARTQHLTLIISGLRGSYPVLKHDGTYQEGAKHRGAALSFKVGLTQKYKPSSQHAAELVRNVGLVVSEQDPPKEAAEVVLEDPVLPDDSLNDSTSSEIEDSVVVDQENNEEDDPGRFERFSLSASLESLLETRFIRVMQLRIKFRLGWAGAEMLLAKIEALQIHEDAIFPELSEDLWRADKSEESLAESYRLPSDPLLDHNGTDPLNLPCCAFVYLLRRLMFCTRFCIVCHNTISAEYEVIKPYVCDSKLCTYQYYNLNHGPSLEYEICHNTETVDLLVSFAYCAAVEGVLEDPLPIGLGLRVPSLVAAVPNQGSRNYDDGLCDFDPLDICEKRSVIAKLIDCLPPISLMKKHLEDKIKLGHAKQKLSDIDPTILSAVWSVLRWCIGSCTAHLEELKDYEDMVQNIDPSWRQFRFSSGAPDAEARFNSAVLDAQKVHKNAIQYPCLYAFHGSALRNWHSIIRRGLWFKNITHGRALGNGIYFAKDGLVSNSYAGRGRTWKNSEIAASHCVALAQIVNHPSQFVSQQNNCFVVSQTNWIMCRYLLVKSDLSRGDTSTSAIPPSLAIETASAIPIQPPFAITPVENQQSDNPFVAHDPLHIPTIGTNPIAIPQPSYKLDKLLLARVQEYIKEENDEEDNLIFDPPRPQQHDDVPVCERQRNGDSWIHDPVWVSQTIQHLMPPPTESTPAATIALQKELKFMLREQEQAESIGDLGWYMPPEFIGDNIYQWIVELHSFDKSLPIAQDLQDRNVNSIVFEIRFPPTFPHSPPFFRLIKPRFLPFFQGGGGHVSGGGSICIDLLTADGWLPSYRVSAVLLQIKLAISNSQPRPARLSQEWYKPYSGREALKGYKRTAFSHGWKLPQGIDALLQV